MSTKSQPPQSPVIRLSLFLLVSFFAITSNAPAQVKPDTSLARNYFIKAEQLSKEAQYDSSNFYFQKAAVIYKNIGLKPNTSAISERLVTCYNRLGINFRKQGEFRQALEYLNMALDVGLNKLGAQNLNVATSNHEIGIVYRSRGDYDKAQKYFHKSLQTRLKVLGEKHQLVASSYNSLGNVYRAKGDHDNALQYYRKALDVSLQTLEAGHPTFAALYNNIGIAYYDKGDYDRALEYFQKSLSIELKTRGEKHPSIASDYNNIGNIYFDQGNYEIAIEYHQKALAVRLQALGEAHADVAESYFNLARACLELRNYEKALEYHMKALTIERQAFGDKHFSVAESYVHIGNVYYQQSHYDQALDFYQKALALQTQIAGEHHPDVALTYQQIAKVYEQKNDVHQALANLQKSLMALVPGFRLDDVRANPELNGVRNEVYLLRSLDAKADALARLSRASRNKADRIKFLESSLLTSTLASQLMDQIRSGYRAEGSKLFLTKQFAGVYDHAISSAWQLFTLTKQNQNLEKAFFFIEKSKSATLRDALQESQAKRFAGIPDTLLEKEKALRIDLAHYETEIQAEKEKEEGEQDQEKLFEFQDRFFALNGEYDQLVEKLEKDFPKYFDLKYQTEIPSVRELQTALDNRTAMVEYSLGDSALFIATIGSEAFELSVVPVDTSFVSAVNVFHQSLKTADHEEFLQNSAILYAKLLRPIEKHIANKKRLIIIPDGILHYVPFEALLSRKTETRIDFTTLDYLIRRYEISYQYSATLFLYQQRKLVTAQGRITASRQSAWDSEPMTGFIGFAPVFCRRGECQCSVVGRCFSAH